MAYIVAQAPYEKRRNLRSAIPELTTTCSAMSRRRRGGVASMRKASRMASADRQRAGVEKDYGMLDGRLVLSTRKAMLFYVLKRLGLRRDAMKENPHEQHIVDLNRSRTEQELTELRISF